MCKQDSLKVRRGLAWAVRLAVAATLPVHVQAQTFVVPRDGTFYVESEPVFAFKATLVEHWSRPVAGKGTLHVFAPVLPTLPGQGKVSTRVMIPEKDGTKTERLVEQSIGKRPMLALHINTDEISPESGLTLWVEYEGVLYARQLKRGKPREPVPALTEDELRVYLGATTTMDHDDPGFRRWLNDKGLRRQRGEEAVQFAHRVFTYLIENAKYGGNTSSYAARRPSRVCKSLANDCGGLALLFVGVMRANEIPARTLFGRWAVPQTGSYGQYHVLAEFFVPKSGWVPVDVSGTIVHKPENRSAFFGNTDGQFLAFHVDTDLEPAPGFHHAWAQYLLLQWSGEGILLPGLQLESRWDVERAPLTGQ